MEESLKAELDEMNYEHPAARTLAAAAIRLARAGDRCDPSDVKTIIQVTKELRAFLNDIAGRQGGEDIDDDGPFGAVRAQVVNPPTL